MSIPPLPAGYTLDPSSGGGAPPLPPGYRMDAPKTAVPASKTEEPDRFAQDKAITDAWAQGHPILGPIARFAVTGGQNAANAITGAPGGIYHAFADPATEEETREAGGPDQVSGLKRIGLGIGRLTTNPIARAASDYAGGKVSLKGAASVLPEALGAGLGQVAGGAVYGKVGEVAPAVVRGAVGAGRNALGRLGPVATAIGQSLDPDVVGLVSPRAAHALRLASKVGKVATKYGAAEDLPSEVIQAGGLRTGAQPAAEPSAALGKIPVRTAAAEPPAAAPTPAAAIPAAAPKVSTAGLQTQLERGLGNEPVQVQPRVTMRNQIPRPEAAEIPAGHTPVKSSVRPEAAEIPAGHTPVESSALKTYKAYDPATREMEFVSKGGQHYIYGDISPEQAAEFDANPSKGKAWNELRNSPGVTQVAQMIGGKRVPTVPGTLTTESGEVIPKSKAGMRPIGNLSQAIRESQPASEAPAGAPLSDVAKQIKKSAGKAAPIPKRAPLGDLGAAIRSAEPGPRGLRDLDFYRVRNQGEQGIPYRPEIHAQATSSLDEAINRIMPGREISENGAPQEIIHGNLSETPAFSVNPGPKGGSWYKFHAGVPETNLRGVHLPTPEEDLSPLLQESLRQALAAKQP